MATSERVYSCKRGEREREREREKQRERESERPQRPRTIWIESIIQKKLLGDK
jgi:hypothetical protein